MENLKQENQKLQNELDDLKGQQCFGKSGYDEQLQHFKNKFEEEQKVVKAERDEALQKCMELEQELKEIKEDRNPLLFTIYEKYNTDYPGRLHLINQLQQWHKLGEIVNPVNPQNQNLDLQKDKKFQDPAEKVEYDLKNDMREMFFPIIDIQEHNKGDKNEDLQIIKIKGELVESIVDVLIVLQSLLKTQSEKPQINEQQRMVLCGLMKRLLGQIPTRDPLKFNGQNSRELPVQIAKLYQILGQMQDKKVKLENLDNQDSDLNVNNVLVIATGIQELILTYEKHILTQKKQREKDSPYMEFDDMVELFKQKSIDDDQQEKLQNSILVSISELGEEYN